MQDSAKPGRAHVACVDADMASAMILALTSCPSSPGLPTSIR